MQINQMTINRKHNLHGDRGNCRAAVQVMHAALVSNADCTEEPNKNL
jgi:hypothetical protein